ncbi:MAG: hypothetical protein ACKOLA_12370 [Spartobacteria bacterium]
MQYFTLIGGFVGFLLTLAVSLLAGKELAAQEAAMAEAEPAPGVSEGEPKPV